MDLHDAAPSVKPNWNAVIRSNARRGNLGDELGDQARVRLANRPVVVAGDHLSFTEWLVFGSEPGPKGVVSHQHSQAKPCIALGQASSPRRPGDQVGVKARDGLLQNRVHHDVRNHFFGDPPSCSGMINSTCDPGNAGNPSFNGTSSSQRGTIAIRAVPLRIAIFPSQRAR